MRRPWARRMRVEGSVRLALKRVDVGEVVLPAEGDENVRLVSQKTPDA